jgi:hypothetical protein
VKVRFTPRARRAALAMAKWWRANRPLAPDLFDLELEAAKRRLEQQPELPPVYAAVRGHVAANIEQWWVEHSPASPDLFAGELEQTMHHICSVRVAGVDGAAQASSRCSGNRSRLDLVKLARRALLLSSDSEHAHGP